MFDVIVGNVGLVYSGDHYDRAVEMFMHYAEQSQTHTGRAADQLVMLMKDGHCIRSYEPEMEETE